MPEWLKSIKSFLGIGSKSVHKGLLDESFTKSSPVEKNLSDENLKKKESDDKTRETASKLGNQTLLEIRDENILKELEAGTGSSEIADNENIKSGKVKPIEENPILKGLNELDRRNIGIDDYEGLPGQLAEIPRIEAPDNIFSKAGLKVKNFFKNRFNSIKKSIVKSHREAVDDYNHYTDDYKKQGAWDRFTWALSNPIAWFRAGVGKNTTELDTIERDIEKAKLNRIAENISTVMGKSEDTDLSLEDLLEENKGKPGSSEGKNSKESIDLGKELEDLSKKDSSGEGPEHDPEFSDTGETFKGVAEGASLASTITHGLQAIASVSKAGIKTQAGLGPLARAPLSVLAAGGNIAKAVEAGKREDKYGAWDEGFNAAENLSFAANYALTGASWIKRANGANVVANNLKYKAIPAVGILTGAIQTGRGITSLVGYNKQKKNIGNLITKINGLSKDQSIDQKKRANYLKILNQINNFSGVKKTKGGFDIASGALNTLGNILKTSVIGAPLGVGIETLGLGVSAVKGLVAGYQHGETKKKTIDEEMGLEEKVSAVRQWMPGLDKEKAKYVVLKSMGIDSGTKKEAFLRMTMKRAMLLKMMADKGSVLPEKTVQAMNLKKTKDHGYSLQAIAMGMGMEGEPWQKQVREAIKKNPFLENLKKK